MNNKLTLTNELLTAIIASLSKDAQSLSNDFSNRAFADARNCSALRKRINFHIVENTAKTVHLVLPFYKGMMAQGKSRAVSDEDLQEVSAGAFLPHPTRTANPSLVRQYGHLLSSLTDKYPH